jgi:hypothetical protein
MFELFVVGTFWFWALVVAEIVLLFAFVNYDNGIGATISLVAFGACLQWFGGVDILGFITTHPVLVLFVLVGYLLAGVTWAVIRWWLFCREQLQRYKAFKAEFLEAHNLPYGAVPENFQQLWLTRLEAHLYHGNRLCDKPLARKHKNRIVGWMAFWVISVVWYLINDFVKEVFKELYNFIAGFMQRIADNMFAGVDEDIKEASGKSATRRDRQ